MWLFENKPLDNNDDLDQYVGFVYIIKNNEDEREYVGKKLFKFRRTKKIKGKKKRLLIDSDWKSYWGSNKSLLEDVKELGESCFERKILRLCKTRGEMNYYEAKYQFDLGVLETDRYYNEWISLRVHKAHVKKIDFIKKSLYVTQNKE
jgi:hypothetical protein